MAGLPPLPPNPLGLPQAPMARGMLFPDVPQPPHLSPVANLMAAPNAGQLLREELLPRPGLPFQARYTTFNQVYSDETKDPCAREYTQILARFDASALNVLEGPVLFNQVVYRIISSLSNTPNIRVNDFFSKKEKTSSLFYFGGGKWL